MPPDAPGMLLRHKIQKCCFRADTEPKFSPWFSVLLCEAASEAAVNWEALPSPTEVPLGFVS